MTSKHTPGPWWRDDSGFVAAGSGESYVTIADFDCSDLDICEREANKALALEAPAMVAALKEARQWIAKGVADGAYNGCAAPLAPNRWLERAAAILSRIDGAGEALPDAPAPVVAALVAFVLQKGLEGDDVEQYTLDCARDTVTELESTGQLETAKAFAQAMADHIEQEPEAWPKA